MTRDQIPALISDASLAPSVHNVQPARWRIDKDGVILFEDMTTRLKVADPTGSDAAISLGAAVEGLALAASRRNLRLAESRVALSSFTSALRPVARYTFQKGGTPDPLGEFVSRRKSWRGAFEPVSSRDRRNVMSLVADDSAVITLERDMADMAQLADKASFGFMREAPFRAELLSWMRLSSRHPRWSVDGLNAGAMQLNRLEAFGAKVVMGPAFRFLDRMSIASKLLAETDKTAKAAGLIVFHRPDGEDAFESGRHFYRLWLRIEALDLGAAVMAALADDADAAGTLAGVAGVQSGRRIVSAFRVGRRPEGISLGRARCPLRDLLV